MTINPVPTNAPRVTQEEVLDSISSEYFFTGKEGLCGKHGYLPDGYDDGLAMVTICVLILKNGHRIVGVNTGSVSDENFDHTLARKLAKENALDQIWGLLGYSLRDRLFKEKTGHA